MKINHRVLRVSKKMSKACDQRKDPPEEDDENDNYENDSWSS